MLRIEDPQFVAASGKTYHAVVKFNGRNDSRVSGTVFEISDGELAEADRYEPAGYKRISATLASGNRRGCTLTRVFHRDVHRATSATMKGDTPNALAWNQDLMANIRLLALDRTAWAAVAADPAAFAVERTLTLGSEPDLLRTVGEQTVAMLQRTGATAPWTGYLAVDREHQVIIGTCAFTAPPDDEGIVEIAYFTFPPFEGRGYASGMAAGLVELAEGTAGILGVRAHTLPEGNASTRILEKLGFERIGEAIDPEAGQVWRWERDSAVHRSRQQEKLQLFRTVAGRAAPQ